MSPWAKRLEEELKAAFERAGFDASFAKIQRSNRPDLCEFQCNGALALAKSAKKPPMQIAEAVKEELKESKVFDKAEAVPPGFLNLTLRSDALLQLLEEMRSGEHFGYKTEHPRRIMIDYGGPNVAKPLHVGHLRSAIIGESLKRIFRYAGHEVISDVHLGDWGLQMGLLIEELRDRKPSLPYFRPDYDESMALTESPFTLTELEEYYPAASERSKTDPAFKERAHNATLRLQRGEKAERGIWKHIMEISVEDLKKNYEKIGVEFDLWKKESDADPFIPEVLRLAEESGCLERSEGALVVQVMREDDKKEIPPCILEKSDGATLYSTTDLATLIDREREYHPDEVLYVVDKRQGMHFEQVFRCAKKICILPESTLLTFLGFGTMNGKDGKPFRTREGGVMRLEVLIREICDAVLNRMKEGRDITEEEARPIADMIGLAALKYGDLSNQATKDYIFDIERFTSFEGNTGPYLLYTVVRMKSILEKYGDLKKVGKDALPRELTLPEGAEERDLFLSLLRFTEAMEEVEKEYAPHKLCSYLYELSNSFNRFYHGTRILQEEKEERQKGQIALLLMTKEVMEDGLRLLGMQAPDKM